MRSQEQAFRAYYTSMTDEELLQTAANRSSYMAIAQRILMDEIRKRDLRLQAAPETPVPHSALRMWGEDLARLARRLPHPHHRAST